MKKQAILGVAIATALLMTSCTGGGAQNAGGSSDGTFTYLYNTAIVTDLDPAVHTSSEQIVLENVYEQLTTYNAETGKVEPELATSWEASEDGLTWTFQLRDDALFHSGRNVDASAVKESIERTMELKSGVSYIWDAVESIEATSETEVVFHLNYPAPLDLISTAGYAAYVYDVEAAGDEDLGDWLNAGNDAGSGPYQIVNFEPGQASELRLEAFEDYPDGWNENQFSAVEFKISPEETTSWQLMQRGEADFVFNLRPELFAEAENNDAVQTFQRPSFTNSFAFLNTEAGPLADVKVREALSKTLDLDAVAELVQGAAEPASGLVPDGIVGALNDMQLQPDLDEAERLLTDAGYGPGGQAIALDVTFEEGNSVLQSIATYWSTSLTPLNITVNAQPLQHTAAYERATAVNPEDRQDIYLAGWWPDYPDANSWYYNLVRSANPPVWNLSYVEDPEIDQLIDAMPELQATDVEGSMDEHRAIQEAIVQEHYGILPTIVYNYQRVLGAGIDGYVDNPLYANVVDVYELRYAAG